MKFGQMSSAPQPSTRRTGSTKSQHESSAPYCSVSARNLLLRCLLLRFPKNGAQPLPDNHFFSGLDSHGNEFDVFLSFDLFAIRISLMNALHEAGVIDAEHFNHRISGAQFGNAIGDS